MGQTDDDHHQDDLTLTCDNDGSDDEIDEGFAINESIGVLHLLAPNENSAIACLTNRTMCGRDQRSPGFALIAYYADSFVGHGELKPESHCSQCASSVAWAAIVE